MMYVLYAIFCICIIYCSFNLLDIFVVTTSSKAESFLLNFDRINDESSVDVFLKKIALRIAPYIKFDDRRYNQIERALRYKGINETPNMYYAIVVVEMGVFILIGIVFIPIFPILTVFMIYVAYSIYSNTTKKIQKFIREKANIIEDELPQFCAAIEQELHGEKNIEQFFMRYMNSSLCGEQLQYEIETCLSFVEQNKSMIRGLSNMAERVESNDLTEITRGLIAVINGDSTVEKFENITERLYEKQKAKAIKKTEDLPNKILAYNFIVYAVLMIFLIASFLLQMMGSLGEYM